MLLMQKKYENYKSDELKKVAAQFDRNKIGEEKIEASSRLSLESAICLFGKSFQS